MRLDGELKRQKEAAELGEMKTTETEVKRRKVSYGCISTFVKIKLNYLTDCQSYYKKLLFKNGC